MFHSVRATRVALASAFAASIVVAGCGGGSAPTPDDPVSAPPVDNPAPPPSAPEAAPPRVVVAVLDSGINPYHAYFNAGSPIYPDSTPSAVTPAVLAEFGIDDDHIIELTRTGDFEADFAADQDIWTNIERGEPYWFRGTNIIASSFTDQEAGGLPVLPEDSTHGTGTSGSVLGANPEAVLFFVEQAENIGSAETHDYAFLHPAVDIVSTSYGVSIPLVAFPLPETTNFENSFTGVVELGKLHFSSGGNSPGLAPARAGAGPWWSIGVSGIEEGDSGGRTPLSGVFPDFVSDFFQSLPYCFRCEDGYTEVGGTSFSTPRAAGVTSKVLLDVRRALNHSGGINLASGTAVMAEGVLDGEPVSVTNWQIRRAMEEAAHVPDVSEYDVAQVTDMGIPVVAAPWTLIGWGDISALPEKNVVPQALAQLGFGDAEVTTKDVGFCTFQSALIAERRVYWNNVAFESESFMNAPEDDPFIGC